MTGPSRAHPCPPERHFFIGGMTGADDEQMLEAALKAAFPIWEFDAPSCPTALPSASYMWMGCMRKTWPTLCTGLPNL